MTRFTTSALFLLTIAACTETPPADDGTSAAALVGAHCGAYTPPLRLWNGVAYPAPYGKITLVLDSTPQSPNVAYAYFVDRVGDFVYDRVKVNRGDIGTMVGSVVALNQDLAIVGSATGVRPGGGGPGPRPGDEAVYALDLAGGLPIAEDNASLGANACPK